ncbi:MAG TPA: PAS domain-containing protein [Rudaea sp.]|jgi:two-component system sensor histidine kinase UhpB
MAQVVAETPGIVVRPERIRRVVVDISGLTDIGSLKGFPVGIKAGDQHVDKLSALGVTTLIPFQNNEAIIAAAKQHKINVFVVDAPSALYLLNKAGIDDEFRQSAPIFHDELRRAVRKGDVAMLRTVSDGFAAIDPGELKQINEKWFGSAINEYARYLAYAGYAAAAALLLILGLAGWNRTLRKGILHRTAALSESELRLRQIAENIREVFWMATPAMDEMLYVSPAYEVIWGRSLDSLHQRPQSFFDAIHIEDREHAIGIAKGRREQGFDIEYRLVRPDGTLRWIRHRGFPVKDDSGKVYRIAGVAEDITDRRHAEDHLRLVIDTIPTMVWSLLPDGALDFTNQRWLEYTGLSLQEAIEKPTAIVHPDDLSRVTEKWRADMAVGGPSEDEMRLRSADGTYRWFLVRTVALRNDVGNVVKWYGTSTDIEDRKRITDALRESELRFRRLVELMPVAVYVCDTSGAIQIYNNRAVELWGREPQPGATAQRYCGSLRLYSTDGKFVPHNQSPMADVLATGVQERDREVLMLRPDGSSMTILANIAPLRDRDGKLVGAINCFQDISERKRADEALRQSEFELAEAQRVARIGSWTLDVALDHLRWSEELYRIFDVDKSEFGGAYEAFLSRVLPEDLPRVMQVNSEARSNGKPFEVEYRITTRAGKHKYIREIGYARKSDTGAVMTMFGTAQDISERKGTENALRASALQLRALSRRLVDLQESERKEISRELHDRIGQNLTALGINLEILRSQAAGDQSGTLRSRLQDSAALVESTADAIENLMAELRPPMLDDYGLLPALDWYAKQFTQRTGISVVVRGNETSERAAPAAETALFRIAQEALNNVAKHARATQVDIVLEQTTTDNRICITDDGTGFDPTANSRERPLRGLGMVTMRERTQAVGGHFEVQTVAGRGTRIVVRIPR